MQRLSVAVADLRLSNVVLRRLPIIDVRYNQIKSNLLVYGSLKYLYKVLTRRITVIISIFKNYLDMLVCCILFGRATFSARCVRRTNRRAIAMMSVRLCVCLSGTGVHCDHTVHLSADFTLRWDSPMSWTS